MPPVALDRSNPPEGKKRKARPPLVGIKMTESPSQYLTKYEWEQVGNLTVHQSGKEDIAQMMLSLTI